MRIPPHYRQPTWQRFFAGIVFGMLTSWVIFLYMHGVMQEKQIVTIIHQKKIIENLTEKIEIWERDYKQLNEVKEESLTIQEVQVSIINGKQYDLDQLSVAEAVEVIQDDLSSLIAKDLETVYSGKSLLRKSIENKVMEINKKRYSLEVVEILFYTSMSIEVKLKRL